MDAATAFESSVRQPVRLTDVLHEGGSLIISFAGEPGEYWATIVGFDGEALESFTAKTIPGVLSKVGAGVTPRKPLFAPGGER